MTHEKDEFLTFSKCIILKAENESKPDVGSSRKRRAGSVISSMPTLVLFLCPPDMPTLESKTEQVRIEQNRLEQIRTD